jgi:hypothetical protein
LANDTPSSYTLLPQETLRQLLAMTAANPWPTIDDRDTWTRLSATPHGAGIRDAALADAVEQEKISAIRPPALSEFMAFMRTGDRRSWEAAFDPFIRRLDAFTLAALFTGEERWVERAADALWAICELTTWVTPAHEPKAVPEPDDPYIDLWATMQAQGLTEALQVLQPALDRIDTRIARRVHQEVDRRVFEPFLARGDWWWLWQQPGRSRLNNWTAVCAGAILCAALAGLNDDPERQARIVHKAAWSLQFFKDTFDEAGSLDEGVGYWAYGVGYFVMAAERLAARTNGQMDPLADPIWREIAQFPLRVRLYGDTFVNFSDCAPTVRPIPGWIAWMGRRLDVPGLVAWADRLADGNAGYGSHHRYMPFVLRTLTWMGGEGLGIRGQGLGQGLGQGETSLTSAPNPQSLTPNPSSSYLPDVQWLIARSAASDDALILAAKGGHNAENHNHNDGGSFIVHWRQEPLICELGAPTYTRQFFSGERYENIAARSLGHSVPYVNMQEQRAGREYAAKVLAREGASLMLELAGLYGPEAKVNSLVRTLALQMDAEGQPFITLSDRAAFTEKDGMLGLPLISMDTEVSVPEPGRAVIRGKRGALVVTYDPARATCRAEEIPTDDTKFQAGNGETRLRHLWFTATVTGKEALLEMVFRASDRNDC